MKYERFKSDDFEPCKFIFHTNDYHIVPLHFHTAIEVNYVYTGAEDWVTMHGDVFRPHHGDVVIFNSNSVHAFTPAVDRSPYKSLTLIYPLARLQSLYPEITKSQLLYNTVSHPQLRQENSYRNLVQAFDSMAEAYNNPDQRLTKISLRRAAYSVLEVILSPKYLTEESKIHLQISDRHTSLLVDCTSYIGNHLTNTLDNTEIASALRVSISTLTHVFSAEMGMSVQQYIKQQRLAKSYSYVSSGDVPVNVISDLVGFPNQEAFIRAFKQTYGTTPYQYRQQMKK